MKIDALGMRRPMCAAGRLQIDCRLLEIEGCVAGQGQAGAILRSPPQAPGTVGPTTADPRLCAVQQDEPTQRAGTTARPEDLVIDRVANPLGRLSQMAICPVDASPPYHRLVFSPPCPPRQAPSIRTGSIVGAGGIPSPIAGII